MGPQVESPSSLLPLFIAGCGVQTKAPEKAQDGSAGRVIKTACGMEMVSIPGGEFTMGTDDGPVDVKPAHRVKVDGFLMDRYEIHPGGV